MTIKTRFDFGDIVYLKTDLDQLERMVLEIRCTPTGEVYTIAVGELCTDHYEIELSDEKRIF